MSAFVLAWDSESWVRRCQNDAMWICTPTSVCMLRGRNAYGTTYVWSMSLASVMTMGTGGDHEATAARRCSPTTGPCMARLLGSFPARRGEKKEGGHAEGSDGGVR